MKKFVLLGVLNLVLVIAVLYLFEALLYATDPRRTLPKDGMFGAMHYTWGHEVRNNRFGFRDREFVEPKPANTCRIMVLGDSLTWGAGLSPEERYTNLAEAKLRHQFPGRSIEVLNFSISGGPTETEAAILRQHIGHTQPDQIVVGFCLNDPQPKGQDFSEEKEAFTQRIDGAIGEVEHALGVFGLHRTAVASRRATYRAAELLGVFPAWEVALDRTYNTASDEWRRFTAALLDIRTQSDRAGLPRPIFSVLNQGTYTDRPTRYSKPDTELKRFLRWYQQAEEAARTAGFRTYNHQQDLIAAMDDATLALNVVDGHPSAAMNVIYADHLARILAEELRAGRLCPD
jgi:lysophospholipase L1-like esterase